MHSLELGTSVKLEKWCEEISINKVRQFCGGSLFLYDCVLIFENKQFILKITWQYDKT